jgi:hypothetical protein
MDKVTVRSKKQDQGWKCSSRGTCLPSKHEAPNSNPSTTKKNYFAIYKHIFPWLNGSYLFTNYTFTFMFISTHYEIYCAA